jgi:single-stranded-DNA-specific exonuclease
MRKRTAMASGATGGSSPEQSALPSGLSVVALPAATWELYPELPLAELDAAAPELTRLQVQVLANRGIRGADAARAFVGAEWISAPPYPLGLDAAVARLRQAGDRRERVVVFGDYDVDGMTSCAVMLTALQVAGIDAHPYLPVRADDGRGLNEAAVRALATESARLIVTTDCGTSNVAEVLLATSLGIDVIVTDHHPPQGEVAPALAVVNPRQPNCPSLDKNLAGVGVAFRVAAALLAGTPGIDHRMVLAGLLDLVAVGTIGDLVTLTRENWTLVHAGLLGLNANPRPGLRALVERAGLAPGAITERDISFALAPRLNAAGRMGSPLLALQLLMTEDAAEARTLADRLEQLNEARQRATQAVMAEARAQALVQMAAGAPAVLVVRGDGWPLGIIGLVAGRLAEEFDRPAIAISVQGAECRGSARSPTGINLVETLAQRADLFRRFGGHAQAAGFTLATDDLDTLVAHVRTAAQAARPAAAAPPFGIPPTGATAADSLAGAEPDLLPDPDLADDELSQVSPNSPAAEAAAPGPAALHVDCRLPLRRALLETYTAIRALAPFGAGFPEPILLATRIRLVRCWRSGPEGRTLRLLLREGTVERSALWSRQGNLLPAVRDLDLVDVAYALDVVTRPGRAPEPLVRVLGLRRAE